MSATMGLEIVSILHGSRDLSKIIDSIQLSDEMQ